MMSITRSPRPWWTCMRASVPMLAICALAACDGTKPDPNAVKLEARIAQLEQEVSTLRSTVTQDQRDLEALGQSRAALEHVRELLEQFPDKGGSVDGPTAPSQSPSDGRGSDGVGGSVSIAIRAVPVREPCEVFLDGTSKGLAPVTVTATSGPHTLQYVWARLDRRRQEVLSFDGTLPATRVVAPD